jgi:hypothetical protein
MDEPQSVSQTRTMPFMSERDQISNTAPTIAADYSSSVVRTVGRLIALSDHD